MGGPALSKLTPYRNSVWLAAITNITASGSNTNTSNSINTCTALSSRSSVSPPNINCATYLIGPTSFSNSLTITSASNISSFNTTMPSYIPSICTLYSSNLTNWSSCD